MLFKRILPLALVALATAVSAQANDRQKLMAVLEAQDEDTKARYEWRNPAKTLEFIGIEPGMTVVEGLPGGGWYTKILLPYLGERGRLIGANYSLELFPLFGFFNDEQLKQLETWTTDFPAQAEEWRGESGAPISAFHFGSMPDEMKGTADAVLMIRAMHNLARFEGQGGFMTAALKDMYDVLRPGGVVGIVQHEARKDKSDEWADGSRGYIKKSFVKSQMHDAGFEYVGSSPINENPKDQPGEEDIVWRLPPGLFTSQEDPELRAKMQAIGESNRMTLVFRKPE